MPELARQLRRAADDKHRPGHDSLMRQIRRWERPGIHEISERYELLYRDIGFRPGEGHTAAVPPQLSSAATRRAQARDGEETDPLLRRTFVGLTGISAIDVLLPTPDTLRQPADTEQLALMLTTQPGSTAQVLPGMRTLMLAVSRARRQYQACQYDELIRALPGLLAQLDAACLTFDGDPRLRACALAADAYHVTAGFLLKCSDLGLAHLATDRSMKAAAASGDPLAVGASARIVTHTLMNSGHLRTAVKTAQDQSMQLRSAVSAPTPESRSVYGSVLLRGAIAAALDGDRDTASDMLTEAGGAARRLDASSNLCGTAFNPVNTVLHQVNIAVTLGDAGTAVNLAAQVDTRQITVTERKASLLIDTARAFFMWGRYEHAHASLRAAEAAAPQEVTTRPAVRALARDLALVAPPSIKRDTAQFAARIGAFT